MGALGPFLAGFSDSFKAALAIWPLLSFALTLPILAYLYHRDGRLRLSSALGAYVSVLYIAGLGCFTLYPLPSGDAGPGITYGIEPQFNPLNFIDDIARDGVKAAFQTVFNIVLFVPLGFIAKRFMHVGLPLTAALSLATTGLIETAQLTGLFGIYPFAYRTFEVDDLIFNTFGGVIGWLCGLALGKVMPSKEEPDLGITCHPGFVRRCVALWMDSLSMALCAFGPWLALDLASELLSDRAIAFFGMSAGQTEGALVIACSLAAFIGVEVLIPWFHGGSTIGGHVVRMSFETKRRQGRQRAVFYGVRALYLLAVLAVPQAMVFVTAVFYLFARQMPYDYLPGSDRQGEEAGEGGPGQREGCRPHPPDAGAAQVCGSRGGYSA